MELNINIEGHMEGDLETALEEVLRLVRQGYRSGQDSNDTGSFNFSVNGSPVENYAVAKKGDSTKLGKKRFDRFDEAQEAAKDGDIIVGLSDIGEVLTES